MDNVNTAHQQPTWWANKGQRRPNQNKQETDSSYANGVKPAINLYMTWVDLDFVKSKPTEI